MTNVRTVAKDVLALLVENGIIHCDLDNKAKTPVVFLDESYIHHHYSRHQDSLFDPTYDAAPKAKHKGRRLCFIAGIMADGPQDAKLLGLDIFEGGKKRKKEPKEYHGMFDHEYFVHGS
ncbi:hypothetical protein H310_14757 [Aphanomyces invadans]|uniref:Tc1-like transposase DDE domain-containing protein n=1 Tax=Aphanomyces invadans TaxID=157072 RepID=A0A024TAW8_9STRA|nr:hypothetical protein H310_14757 [Aphanomyces invadans]ETV90457.1 hypothetical protein H310_14757 [Aphanomyces invadans]|eukprot:XP_008880906.1 hypothetical protein H310_14757 [Aphanomyces invadans]